MSYPRSLDEYADEELRGELRERARLRQQGLCDYCQQPLGKQPPCRFAARHNLKGKIPHD